MFIYAGGRQVGKTEKMIDWFLGDPVNRIIITLDATQANYIIKRIKDSKGAEFPFYDHIYPYHEAKRMLGTRGLRIGIDNLDMILSDMFRSQVEFVTLTGTTFDAPRVKPWWRFW